MIDYIKALDEKQSQQGIELYQARISKVNKKVKKRVLQQEDLVLTIKRSMVITYKTKGKF